MKIVYYMPFKPLGHRNPSGDLIIGTEIFEFLGSRGVEIELASKFRCRWIYFKPQLWPLLFVEFFRVLWLCRKVKPDLWLTYHSYYKAPDIIGSLCCRLLGIPYVIFQGIYSTKRRKKLKTWAGFYLNRMALSQADRVLNNKRPDHFNLARLLPEDRLAYVPPGLHPEDFQFSESSRKQTRERLMAKDRVLVMTAAMFRPGVKTRGLLQVIESCRVLLEKGCELFLIIAGDGSERTRIADQAEAELGDNCLLLGKIPRYSMAEYYSAADVFAFPGIEESLGMVYLEAQSCGLPVVACRDWGAKEAVVDGETGLLCAAADEHHFTLNLEKLIHDSRLRKELGRAAAEHVRRNHDITRNYETIHNHLKEIARKNH